MTYDDAAKKLAIKVIGTVESNLNYSAINYNDPITVGVVQWYGVRAATILDRLRDENPTEWYGVEPSLDSQLTTIPATDTFWNNRYLTTAEGESLVDVLDRNQALQNDQVITDLDAYKAVAVAHGINPDTNTATMIFFFAMYHQGPVYALNVLDDVGGTATLDQIYAACLNDAVLGKYGSRYKTAYDLISVQDLSGVDPTPPPTPPAVQPNGNARTITASGDLLIVRFLDGERVTYYPSGHGQWVPRKAGTAPPAPTPTQPPPPAGTGSWVLPLTGNPTMTSGYGPRAFDGLAYFHYGADLANPAGSPGDVVANTDLILTRAYNVGDPGANATAGGYVKGHTLDGAYTFTFNHMAEGSVIVHAGDTVTAGQKLGVEGATGNVTGQHLHFECYEGALDDPWAPPYGNPIDPLPVLRAHGVNI